MASPNRLSLQKTNQNHSDNQTQGASCPSGQQDITEAIKHKYDNYLSLAWKDEIENPNAAYAYFDEAYAIADKIDNEVLKYKALLSKADYCCKVELYWDAKDALEKAKTLKNIDKTNKDELDLMYGEVNQMFDAIFKLSTEKLDCHKQIKQYQIMGHGAYRLGHYNQALNYYRNMFHQAQEAGDTCTEDIFSYIRPWKNSTEYKEMICYYQTLYGLVKHMPEKAYTILCDYAEALSQGGQSYDEIKKVCNEAVSAAEKCDNVSNKIKVLKKLLNYQRQYSKMDDIPKTMKLLENLEPSHIQDTVKDVTAKDEANGNINDNPEQRNKQNGPVSHQQNLRGQSQLHRACISGDYEKFQRLINYKNLLNLGDHSGATPLHEACKAGHLKMVTSLIECAANVNAKNIKGETPLLIAAVEGHLEIVKLLLRNGASPLEQIKNGSTVFNEFEEFIQDMSEDKDDFNNDIRCLYNEIQKTLKRYIINKGVHSITNNVLRSTPDPGTSIARSSEIPDAPGKLHTPVPQSHNSEIPQSFLSQQNICGTSQISQTQPHNSGLSQTFGIQSSTSGMSQKSQNQPSAISKITQTFEVHPSTSKIPRTSISEILEAFESQSSTSELSQTNESQPSPSKILQTTVPCLATPETDLSVNSANRKRTSEPVLSVSKIGTCGNNEKRISTTPTTKSHLNRATIRLPDGENISGVSFAESPEYSSLLTSTPNLVGSESEDTYNIIAKMVARDKMSFQVITTKSLRELFLKAGYKNIPTSTNVVKTMIIQKSKQIKNIVKYNIKKDNSHLMSLSLDEWISSRNHKYIDINIHALKNDDLNEKIITDIENLGLIRVKENDTNDFILESLKEKLSYFGVSLHKDIGCIVTKNVSILTDISKIDTCYKQLCVAHGIQCAVLEVLYEKIQSPNSSNDNTSEKTAYIDESEIDDSTNVFNLLIQKPATPGLKLIERLQKVKTFMNTYSGESEVKYLIMNCEKSWLALTDLLKKFIKLENETLNTPKRKKVNPEIKITKSERDVLKQLCESLNCITETVNFLYNNKPGLLAAELVLKLMMETLNKQHSLTCKQLYKSISLNITELRNINLISTLNYLHNPNTLDQSQHNVSSKVKSKMDIFPIATKSAIHETILNLSKKLFGNELMHNKKNKNNKFYKSYTERLNKAVSEHLNSGPYSTSKLDLYSEEDLVSTIENDLTQYENAKEKSMYLKRIYDYLSSIPSTCITREKAFSTNTFDSYLNCSFKDDTLDALSFLRCYYLQ